MLIDEFIDEPNFSETHEIVIAAPMDRVFDALFEVTPAEVPMFRLLMGVRTLPGRLIGRGTFVDDRPLFEQFSGINFKELALDPPNEVVAGGIGRFWHIDGGPHEFSTPTEFKAFHQPGFAKVAFNFHLSPDDAASRDHATLLRTDTRVEVTDDGAHRRFFIYWAAISWGSGEIRKDWLRAIKVRAESQVREH